MSYTDEFTGVTYPWSEEWEQRQPGETERERGDRVGTAKFDHDYYLDYGRYPEESPLFGTEPSVVDAKRAATREKIERLAAESPFEGERASARARLAAFDNPSSSAHAATERGSYYARDTLTGSSDERSHE